MTAAAVEVGATLCHHDGRTGTFVCMEADGRYRVQSLKGKGFWIFHPDDCVGAQPAAEPEWQSEAIGFLYVLLGSAPQVSANILQANPEVRNRLHRAIYERRPQDEPYDEMMARLLPGGLPIGESREGAA